MKKRGRQPLPSVVMTKSGANTYHSHEGRDQLIVNSSDEDECDQDIKFDVKAKDIDTEGKFCTTNPYQEHVYEDTN